MKPDEFNELDDLYDYLIFEAEQRGVTVAELLEAPEEEDNEWIPEN